MLLRSRSRSARRTPVTTPAVVEQLEVRTMLSAGALDKSFSGDGVVTTEIRHRSLVMTFVKTPLLRSNAQRAILGRRGHPRPNMLGAECQSEGQHLPPGC